MPLQIGIVGLPNAGKSTLFNALTRASVAVANYPFTTIEPHVGVAVVPDERLDAVARLVKPAKVVPATIQFVDIAGLVAGAHRGEGLGNQFLAAIREVDAIALVLRCFEDADVPHVSAALDPIADLEVLDIELTLADLGTVERRIERTCSAAKGNPKEHEWELTTLARLQEHLAAGHPARKLAQRTVDTHPRKSDGGTAAVPRASTVPRAFGGIGGEDSLHALLADLFLLTSKPRLLVANVGEDALPEGGPMAARVLQYAAAVDCQAIVLCAECEAGLADWSPEEAAAYRVELGLSEPGLNRLVRASYALLDLITFFTLTGGEVVRAWTLRRGLTAWHAAGLVHTDIQRGFVRADVIACPDLLAAGSMAHARETGRLRSEGRDYVVADGDVIHVHFTA